MIALALIRLGKRQKRSSVIRFSRHVSIHRNSTMTGDGTAHIETFLCNSSLSCKGQCTTASVRAARFTHTQQITWDPRHGTHTIQFIHHLREVGQCNTSAVCPTNLSIRLFYLEWPKFHFVPTVIVQRGFWCSGVALRMCAGSIQIST